MTTRTEPAVLDALSLLAQVADELVVDTARDTHLAWARPGPRARCARSLGRPRGSGGGSTAASPARSTAASGSGSGAPRGPRPLAARAPVRPGGRPARPLRPLGGQRADRRPARARAAAAGDHDGAAGRGRDVPRPRRARRGVPRRRPGGSSSSCTGSARTRPTGTGTATRRGTTYAEELAAAGWTPVLLRVNTGPAAARERRRAGRAAAAPGRGWPIEVERVALIGHSMGGLVIRAATAVPGGVAVDAAASPTSSRSARRTSARRWRAGSATAAGCSPGCPRSAAFGRILDQRSVGVHDLIEGLDEDVPRRCRTRATGSSRRP